MKILLIGPDSGNCAASRMFLAPQTGIQRLAVYIRKQGHYVNVVDSSFSGG